MKVLGFSILLAFTIMAGFHHFIKVEFLGLSAVVSNLVEENLTKNKDYQHQARNKKFPTEYLDYSKRMPTAVIIGVRKAGTRAMLEMIKMHPQVY